MSKYKYSAADVSIQNLVRNLLIETVPIINSNILLANVLILILMVICTCIPYVHLYLIIRTFML